MMLDRFFKTDPIRIAAESLYLAILTQARKPVFYTAGCVADSVDGRFDMIVLHVFLIIRRLKQDGDSNPRLRQMLFDVMFENMDASLREMGVGDLSVGKKIKAMAEAFYGRASAYEDCLKSGHSPALSEALHRNLYRNEPVKPEVLEGMAAYILDQEANLASQHIDDLGQGHLSFVSLEAPHGER